MTAPSQPTRAAVYLRMSDDRQGNSIERQRSQVLPYAAKQGYTVVEQYIDEGISGDRFEERKGLQKLLADAAAKRFSVLVIDEPSRLSRQQPIDFIALVVKPLKDAGVRLDTVSKGPRPWDSLPGILMEVIDSDQSSGEQLKNSRRVLTDRANRARAGKLLGGVPPYGYLVQYETVEREGKPPLIVPVKLILDPRRAHIVIWIFERYAEGGVTMDEIARELNARGAPPPAGCGGREAKGGRIVRWNRGGVRAILSNPRYVGAQVWNRRNRSRHHVLKAGAVEEKTHAKNVPNDRAEWYVVPDTHEPIIAQELFDRVQARLEWNKGGRKPSARGGYLFSGLVICGKCGRTLAGITRDGKQFYRCQRFNEVGEVVCGYGAIGERDILNALLQCVQKQLLAPDRLDSLREQIRQEADRQRAPDAMKALRKRLRELETKIIRGNENLLTLPPERVAKVLPILGQWEQERDELREKQTRLTGHADERELEEQIATAEAMLWGLREASDQDDPLLLRQIVRGTVARVEVNFREQRKTKRTWRYPTGGVFHLRTHTVAPALHDLPSS